MQFLKRSFLTWVLVLASTKALAACPDMKSQLADLVKTPEFLRLSQFGVNTTKGPVRFVTLNHRTGDFQVFRWQPGVHDFTPVTFERDSEGLPRINLSRRERGVFVLTNSTPPLYGVSKTTTPDDIPELKNLKDILKAFASLAVNWVKPGPGALAAMGATLENQPKDEELKALRDALVEADQQIAGVTADKDASIRFLQYAEFGESSVGPDPALAHGRLVTLRVAFDKVAAARVALLKSAFADQHRCMAVRALVESMKDIDWSDNAAVQAKRAEITSKIATTTCSDAAQAAAVGALFDESTVVAYLANAATFDGIIAAADEALGREAAAIENAAAIRNIFTSTAAINACDYVEGIVIATSPDQIAFDKTGLVKVTLKPVNALGHSFKRRADAPAEVSYRTINPVAGNIGYGVGIVYTPLSNPVFGAVENPANKEEKVIARTGEESRAGELALLGTYRFGTPGAMFRPGIQFGAGVSEDLATFLGLSFDFRIDLQARSRRNGSAGRRARGRTASHAVECRRNSRARITNESKRRH